MFNLKLGKKDLLAIFIISELDAFLILAIAKNIAFQIPFFWLLPVFLPILSFVGFELLIFLSRWLPTLFQFGKFLLVGTLNTFIDLGVLNLLMLFSGIAAGFYYSLFKAISFSIANLNSYFWNKYWTFEATSKKKISREFGEFYLVSIAGLLINVLTASIVVNLIGPHFGLNQKLWANVGALVATFAGFTWNFFGYKLIVFKK